MSGHVIFTGEPRGRDVELFEGVYLGEAITVAADVVRRLHESGFKLKSVYLGGSKHWVAAKSMIGVHSMPLNNIGLKGLKDGDAQMFSFAVKVTNLQGYKADGKMHEDGVGAEETWRRAVVRVLRKLFGQGFDELNLELCGASVHKDKDGSLILYCCCSTVPAGTYVGTRDLYKLALRDGLIVSGYRGGSLRVRWPEAAQDYLVEVVKAQLGTGYWKEVAAAVAGRFPDLLSTVSADACADAYYGLAPRYADAPLGPAPGTTGLGVGGGVATVVDLGRYSPEDRDAIEKACADAAALAAAARSNKTATRVRCGEVWLDAHDAALRRAVAAAGTPPEDGRGAGGGNGYWPKVAATVPGKTKEKCMQRWKYELDPSICREPFTPEEVRTILSEYTGGKRWAAIAKRLPGRTDNMIKNRWNGATGLGKRLEAFLKKQPSSVLDLSGPLLEKAVDACMAPPPKRKRPAKRKSASVPSQPSSPPSVPTPLAAAAAAAAPGPLYAPPPVAPSSAASPDATQSQPPSSPPPVSTPLAAAVAASEPPSALRETLIKWKLSGATVAVTPVMTRVVLNTGRWSDDELVRLWDAYKETNYGTAPFWTITAAKRVRTRSPKQCRGRMPGLLAAMQRALGATAGGVARRAVALAPPTEVRPSLQDFRDKRVVISGDLPATKEQLTDVLVELLHVEAVTGSTSSTTNYVIGYKDSGHDNVTKAGNRLVDPDYFMSLLEEDAIERATAASAERLKARPIRWCDVGLTPQALRGKGVARTGGVSGLDRHQVCAAIQRLGATVHCSVTAETDFLVYGSRAGGKVKAARAHGVPCIPEAVFRRLLSAASAPAPAPCAVAAPSPRRRALAENGPRVEPAAKRHC